jgi:hypothetical protein
MMGQSVEKFYSCGVRSRKNHYNFTMHNAWHAFCSTLFAKRQMTGVSIFTWTTNKGRAKSPKRETGITVAMLDFEASMSRGFGG